MSWEYQKRQSRHGNQVGMSRKVQRSGRAHTFYHCGACNFRVRPQAVVEIRNQGALVLCDSCKRILYFDEAEA